MAFEINMDFGLVHEFYDLYVKWDGDVAFWVDMAKCIPGPRLELMCGTGRLLLPILKAGIDIEGLDYARQLLDVLKRKLAADGLTAVTHLADARDFSLTKTYGLIYIAFHSIAEVVDDDDKLKVFESVHRHLRPGGLFCVTIHNPPRRRVNLDGKCVSIGTYRLPGSGEQVEIDAHSVLDPASQIVTGVQTYRCTRGGELTRLVELPMRWHLIEPPALEHLLEQADLRVVERFGDYERSAFSPQDSPFFIACCRSK